MPQRSVRLYAIEASGRDADEQWISAYLVMPQRTDASAYWQAVCDSILWQRRLNENGRVCVDVIRLAML